MSLRERTFYFAYAYYKGRWVIVPMLYVPEDAVGDDGYLHRYKIVFLDDQVHISPQRRSCKPAFDRIASFASECILPERFSKSEIRDLCSRNSIPLGWVTGFYKKKEVLEKPREKLKKKNHRKFTHLNLENYKLFIKELKRISKQSAVIAEILWFLNTELLEGDCHVTLEEVLRLSIEDVPLDDGINTCISLKRSSLHGDRLLAHYLPKHIWEPLCQLILSDCFYVFSNKKGGLLLPDNINKDFRKAGKKAGLKGTVSSLSLRPCKEPHLREISISEWTALSELIPKLCTTRGCPSIHDPRNVFNAILYNLRTRTPFRRLPPEFPPGSAVHSQYRRWSKNGVFEAVLQARSKKEPLFKEN